MPYLIKELVQKLKTRAVFATFEEAKKWAMEHHDPKNWESHEFRIYEVGPDFEKALLTRCAGCWWGDVRDLREKE